MIRVIGVGDNVVDRNYTTGIMYPGGNSYNFAVFGRQLGYETAYAGVIGSDAEAEIVLKPLRFYGVDISRCQFVEGETGICGIHLKDGDRTIVDENDAGAVKSQPFQITEEVLTYLKGFDLVHSSCFSHIEDQLIKVKQAGIPVLYDFSDVWNEESFARICPSINIAFFSGKDLSQEKLKELLERCVNQYGCDMAVTTMGVRGALVCRGKKFYYREPYNVQGGAVDTTGAGDSWITAFITTYLEYRKRLEELKKDGQERFLRTVDEDDYEDGLISFAMSNGNLLARRNCLVEGSMGFGVKF